MAAPAEAPSVAAWTRPPPVGAHARSSARAASGSRRTATARGRRSAASPRPAGAAAATRGRARAGVREGGIRLETYVDGVGPTFVVIPSYGRGSGTDFDDLTARLVTAGWAGLRPPPRGGGGAVGPM